MAYGWILGRLVVVLTTAITLWGCAGGTPLTEDGLDALVNGEDDSTGDTEVLGYLPDGPLSDPDSAASNVTLAEVDAIGVQLTWTDNANDEQGYRIDRSVADGDWTELQTVGPDIEAFLDTQTVSGVNYCYQVVAFNAGVELSSDTSCITPVTTAGDDLDDEMDAAEDDLDTAGLDDEAEEDEEPQGDAAPGEVKAVAGDDGAISVSWLDRSKNETSFQIQRKTLVTAWADYKTVSAGQTTLVDTDVVADMKYCYRVVAKFANDTRLVSAQSCATVEAAEDTTTGTSGGGGGGAGGGGTGGGGDIPGTGGGQPPGGTEPAPGTLDVMATGPRQMVVRWAAADSGQTGYVVERFATQGSLLQKFTFGPNVTQFVDNAVVKDETYCYRLYVAHGSTMSDPTPFECEIPMADSGVPPAPMRQILVTNEAELHQAALTAQLEDVEILIDRKIEMQLGVRFAGDERTCHIRGITPEAHISFAGRLWDGDWANINGTNSFNAIDATCKRIRIEGVRFSSWQMRGSLFKVRTGERYEVTNCVIEDISTHVYPPKSSDMSTAASFYFGNVFSSSNETTHLIVTDCVFRRCVTQSNFSHVFYIDTRTVLVANNLFEQCANIFHYTSQKPHHRNYVTIGNEIRDSRPSMRAGEWFPPIMIYYGPKPSFFMFNKWGGLYAYCHLRDVDSGVLVSDYNDFSDVSVLFSWSYEPIHLAGALALWQAAGHDLHSVFPPH